MEPRHAAGLGPARRPGTSRGAASGARPQPALYRRTGPARTRPRWRRLSLVVADDSEQSVFAYLRMPGGNGPPILTVVNFTPMARDGYRLGVPEAGPWRTVLDTDAACYGGS